MNVTNWVNIFLVFFCFDVLNYLAGQIQSGTASEEFITAKKSLYFPGTDITEQLYQDLNSGFDVTLPAGVFYLSESVIIHGYKGTIKGAGKSSTIIKPSDKFIAKVDPIIGKDYELAEMLAFEYLTGDITFKDFSIIVENNVPAVMHNNPFHGKAAVIDNAIVVAAIHKDVKHDILVTYKNLLIKGGNSNKHGAINGKNLCYALIATGEYGVQGNLNLLIKNCEIENTGKFAIEYFDVGESRVVIKNNVLNNCYGGIGLGNIKDSPKFKGKLFISQNKFNGITEAAIKNHGNWSKHRLKNNLLNGEILSENVK